MHVDLQLEVTLCQEMKVGVKTDFREPDFMKNIILILLIGALFSCNKNEEKSEPLLACPLLYEMEKIEIVFELSSSNPANPELSIDQRVIKSCQDSEREICLARIDSSPMKLSFKLLGHKKLDENVLIDLLDSGVVRVSRQNELIERARTRPNDKCGSGFFSKITIKE